MNQKEGGRVAKENHPVADDNSSTTTGFGGGLRPENADPGSGRASGSGDADACPHCGQKLSRDSAVERFLGRLGVTADMVEGLTGQFDNAEMDEYLKTAREYLKDGSSKAQRYAKDNRGKIAVGMAVLALGAGLIWSNCHTSQDREDLSRQLELKRALRGRKYRLDEVLRELDVHV